jgi:hypothetical protein
MSRAKQASKGKRGSKAVPALGAAGLSVSLTLASGASIATTASVDTRTRSTGVSHEIALREEEIFDVSLATFYIFDKEGIAQPGARRLAAGCACCQFAQAPSTAFGNDAFSFPPSHPIRPPHKYVRKKP